MLHDTQSRELWPALGAKDSLVRRATDKKTL
jgi:hypothetical protein